MALVTWSNNSVIKGEIYEVEALRSCKCQFAVLLKGVGYRDYSYCGACSSEYMQGQCYAEKFFSPLKEDGSTKKLSLSVEVLEVLELETIEVN